MTNKVQTVKAAPEDQAYSLGGIDSYVWTPGMQSVSMPITATGEALEAVLSKQFPGAEISLKCHEGSGLSLIDVQFNAAAADIKHKAVAIAAIFNGTDYADGKRTAVLKKIGEYLIDWNVDKVIVNDTEAESHRAKDVVTPQLLEAVNRKARRAAPQAFMRLLQNNFA